MTRLMQDVVVGDWYRMGEAPPFEIVAVDSDSETIEIQHFDGTVEEIDFDNWLEMPVEMTVAPEDYSGALDIEREDYAMESDALFMDDWSSPMDQIDRIDGSYL